MRSGSLAVLLSTLLLPFPLSAQKCSEQFIRSHVDNPGPELLADDVYFFSGALEKPAIGHDTEESRKTDEKIRAERKNEKHDPHKLDRVVVAASGDMAYAYGTTHLSFDEVASSKHIDFTAAFLMVWRDIGGSCKIAAMIYEPEGVK